MESVPETQPSNFIFSSLGIKDACMVVGDKTWILQEVCTLLGLQLRVKKIIH